MSKILGVDPGFDRIGFAILETDTEEVLFSECFSPEKTKEDLRLNDVTDRFVELLEEHKPDEVAIESVFFTKNTKTAMRVANVIGSLTYQAQSKNLTVSQYTPSQIKLAVCGHGRAEKSQIMQMIPKLVKMSSDAEIDDEFDAVAVAYTHSTVRKI